MNLKSHLYVLFVVCLAISVSACVSPPKAPPPVAADPSIAIDFSRIDVSCTQENGGSAEKASGNTLGNILDNGISNWGLVWVDKDARKDSKEGPLRKGITVEWPSEDSDLCKARMQDFKCECRRKPGQARKRLSQQ